MGRKAKRAKVLVRQMRITGQEIDPVVARRNGVEKQNQQLIDAREAKEADAKRLVEEAERKKREALEAKQKAEAKRKADEAKRKADEAAKKKAEAASKKKEKSPEKEK